MCVCVCVYEAKSGSVSSDEDEGEETGPVREQIRKVRVRCECVCVCVSVCARACVLAAHFALVGATMCACPHACVPITPNIQVRLMHRHVHTSRAQPQIVRQALPNGDLSERDLTQLSGGERRRVALALALGFSSLIRDRGKLTCNLLVLDEVSVSVASMLGSCACMCLWAFLPMIARRTHAPLYTSVCMHAGLCFWSSCACPRLYRPCSCTQVLSTACIASSVVVLVCLCVCPSMNCGSAGSSAA